ncbi:MAG: hypothetical protein JXA99_11910, partial [Candidatus Lokiarchaeota archaeon]|nr:hypothetical protein [Candidatus Lokiarchaeota archaeon]
MRLKLFLHFVIFLQIAIIGQVQIINQEIKINQLSFDIELGKYLYEDKVKENFTVRDFYNYTNESSPGTLKLPYRDIFVAIPPNSKPEVEVITLNTNISKKVLPTLNLQGEKFDNEVNYQNSIEYKDALLKQEENEKFYSTEYFWFRDFYILKIRIRNVKFDYNTTSLIENSKVKVIINFQEIQNLIDYAQLDIKSDFDKIISNLIINENIAEQFRCKVKQIVKDNTGNWIDYDQTYLKMGVSKDGVYRIYKSDLDELGIIINDPRRFQMFESGNEYPIFVVGENDGIFNEGDYIEFYGTKNYTGQDYKNVANSNTTDIELLDRYSDTTFYFLTWNKDLGNRINVQDYFISGIGDTIEFYTSIIHFNNDKNLFTVNTETQNQNPLWLNTDIWAEGSLRENNKISKDFYTNNLLFDKTASIYYKIVSVSAIPPPHKVTLYLNTITKIDSQNVFTNDRRLIGNIFSSSFLKEGKNTITLLNRDNDTIAPPPMNDINQIVYDWYEVEYSRKLSALEDSLKFKFKYDFNSGFKNIKISNVQSNNILIYQISPQLKKINAYIKENDKLLFTDTLEIGKEYFLCSDNNYFKPKFYQINKFVNLRDNNIEGEYIIITNKIFGSAVGNYINFIKNNYLSEETNQSITAKVIYVDDIYNEFGYGYPTPESIKEFLKIAYINWQSPKPKYLFLIGSANYYYKLEKPDFINKNLVPSFGYPVSDTWYCIWDELNPYIPQMYVGRLPIQTNQEIENYLSKHNDYINQKYTEFNKKMILFSGGLNDFERNLMKNVNEQIQVNSVNRPLSLISTLFYNTGIPNQSFGPYPVSYVRDEIEKGGILINYIGHSAMNTWDNTITDPAMLNNNLNKSSLITDFGCATNKFAEPNAKSFSTLAVINEKFIGYIANSSLGFTTTTYNSSKYFYESIFIDSLYEIGEIHLSTKMKNLTYLGQSFTTWLFAMTNLLIGDPIVKINFNENPNLFINNEMYKLSNLFPIDSEDSISIFIEFKNLGLAPEDSFNIELKHIYLESDITFFFRKILPCFKDSILVSLPIKNKPGEHLLRIRLDSENEIDEGLEYESDNYLELNFNVISSQLRPIIYNKNTSSIRNTITYLNPNILPPDVNRIIYRVADNEEYSSPIQFETKVDTMITKVNLSDVPFLDSTRLWIESGLKTDNIFWNESISFIKDTINMKYDLRDKYSADRTSYENIEYSDNRFLLEAKVDTFKIKLESAGYNVLEGYANILINGQSVFPAIFNWGMSIAIIDSTDFSVDTAWQFYYGGNPQEANDLAKLINSTSDGKIIAICVATDGRSNLNDSLKNTLKSIGSTKIDSLKWNSPWLLLAQKGVIPPIIEKFEGPTYDSILTYEIEYYKEKSIKAQLITEKIGPSSKWKFLQVKDNDDNEDRIKYYPIVYRSNNIADTLRQMSLNDGFSDLSFISSDYKYLQILTDIDLQNNNKPLIIEKIAIDFIGIPELVTNFQVVNISADSINQGETIYLNFYVYNVGESVANDFKVSTEIVDMRTNTVEQVFSEFVDSLSSNDREKFEINYNTVNNNGYKKFRIRIDSSNVVPELYEDNNIFEIPFYIKRDTTKPDILVTFDGNDILEGDFVSSDVEIFIELNEPSLIPINDPNSIAIYLDGRRINYSTDSDSLSYTFSEQNPKVKVNYKPNL